MATVKLGTLILHDQWPGAADPHLGIPTSGWDNTTDNCVTVGTYPVGCKIAAYSDNSHNPGWYTMMYAGFASYCAAADISGDFSDGAQWCGHCDLTQDAGDATYEIPAALRDGSHCPIGCLASCYTASGVDISKGGPVALPCATLAGYQHGWFWVGGVCPLDDVTLFQGTIGSNLGADMTTDGAIAGGQFFICPTGKAGTIFYDWSTAVDVCVGIASAAPHGICTMDDG